MGRIGDNALAGVARLHYQEALENDRDEDTPPTSPPPMSPRCKPTPGRSGQTDVVLATYLHRLDKVEVGLTLNRLPIYVGGRTSDCPG